jgi:cobalt-zinc-cadmium resistance protein CzcA
MPFSVSAGVGFIALFGIAVLNGIVLIEHLKELQKSGLPMREVILQGTRDRLRPVMLTAGAAAMGFLPMAISSGAGAEVQRPLATVVIGGLITSTMLTMIALPLFFELFYNVVGVKLFPLRFLRSKTLLSLLLISCAAVSLRAQPQDLTMDKAVELALKNNRELASKKLEVDKSSVLEQTAFDMDKTNITYGSDQNNVAPNGYPLKVWGVSQSFRFPTVYGNQLRSKRIETELSETEFDIHRNRLIKDVVKSYMDIQLIACKTVIYTDLDGLYAKLVQAIESKNNRGDASSLELLTIKSKKSLNERLLKACEYDLAQAYKQLKLLLNVQDEIVVTDSLVILPEFVQTPNNSPEITRLNLLKDYSKSLIKLEKSGLYPDLSINYFLGTNSYPDSKYYTGFEVGLAIPLIFKGQYARIKASSIADRAVGLYAQDQIDKVNLRRDELLTERMKYNSAISAYQLSLLPLHNELLRTAEQSYRQGEINIFQFVNSYEMAYAIQLDYFENVRLYNINIFELQYFTN